MFVRWFTMQHCVAVFLWHHFGITQKKPAELAHCQRMAAMAGLLQASSTDCALHSTGQWQIVGQLRQLRVAWCRRKRVFFGAQVTCKIAQRIPLRMDVPNDEIDRLVGKMHEITLWWTNILLWKDPPFLMGKSTISMAIFNCYVSSPEGISNLGMPLFSKKPHLLLWVRSSITMYRL